jgi:hypothetical protein
MYRLLTPGSREDLIRSMTSDAPASTNVRMAMPRDRAALGILVAGLAASMVLGTWPVPPRERGYLELAFIVGSALLATSTILASLTGSRLLVASPAQAYWLAVPFAMMSATGLSRAGRGGVAGVVVIAASMFVARAVSRVDAVARWIIVALSGWMVVATMLDL